MMKVKQEVHPHRALRTRTLYAAKEVLIQFLGLAEEDAAVVWTPKAGIAVRGKMMATLANIAARITWSTEFKIMAGEKVGEAEILLTLAARG